jgi:ribosome-associated translation inhibitor RaiA
MTVAVQGLGRDAALAARVREKLTETIEHLGVKAVGARVRFADENGPKGGVDVRCTITVRVPRRPPVAVESLAATRRLAVEEALAALARRLDRETGRMRAARRRPKKYFVAKRLMLP